MSSLADVFVEGRINTDRFGSDLKSGLNSSGVRSSMSSAGKTSGGHFSSAFKSAVKIGAAGTLVAAAAAIKVGKDSIVAASDLNESLNAVNLTYGKQAKAVRKLGRESAEAIGLSNSEFNGLAVQFSSFATTIAGGPGKKVVGTLDDLTTRASDFASVMNLEVNEATALFQSGLAGESEPLRKYGLDLSAAKVSAFALSSGIVKTTDDLTESAKVQARYALLMKDTAKTQGDFTNTSGELANSQRILSARWEDAKAKLGTALLPIMKDVVGFVNREGIPVFEKYADLFTKKGIPALQDFADEARPLVRELLPAVGDALGTVRDVLRDAAPLAKDLVGAFNDMPDWAKKALVTGAVGGFAAKKLGVGSLLTGGRGGGGLLGAFSKAAPLPVIVVNEGFGLPGGGGPGSKVPPVVPTGVPKAGPLGGVFSKIAPFIPLLPGVSEDENVGQPAMASAAQSRAMLRQIKADAADAASSITALFAGPLLPKSLATHIKVEGVPQSLTEAKRLAKQYDLTAAERKTLFQTAGIPTATKQSAILLRQYGFLSKPVTTHVYADTASAMAKLNAVRTTLLNLPALGSYGAGLGVLAPTDKRPHREHGGPVVAGREYIVGERRPEVFRPNVNGTILPRVPDRSDSAQGMSSGGGPAVINIYDVDGRLMGSMRGEIEDDRSYRGTLGRQGVN